MSDNPLSRARVRTYSGETWVSVTDLTRALLTTSLELQRANKPQAAEALEALAMTMEVQAR